MIKEFKLPIPVFNLWCALYRLIFTYIASNILIQRRCRCDDILFCTCHQQQKPVVKLGDFSSSSDVTGYEQMRITAVDIWSFGCLLLDIFTGEHGPLVTQRQVDEVRHANVIKINMQSFYSNLWRYRCIMLMIIGCVI